MEGKNMNKLSIGVALVVSALVVGCQDSNFNNPISSDFSKNAPSLSKGNFSNPDGTFELKAQLTFGESENMENTFDLTGSIQYTLVAAGGDEPYALSLVTDATLQSLGSPGETGKVYAESIDFLDLSGKESVSYEKAYKIDQLARLLELHVAFDITPDNVSINRMWLAEVSGRLSAKGPK